MKCSATFFLMIFSALGAFAASLEHGTLIRTATLYVSPGATSEKLMQVERGHDMVVLERTNTDKQLWLKVFVTIVQGETQREVTGWLPERGIITVSTPDGDQIVYGEAVDSESQAEQRGGRKGAAQDAFRLYYRLYEYFPSSPLAGESLWRSADIRWQLERTDNMSRPSWRELDPEARPPIEEHLMKEVIKRFPQSRWADLAAYDIIDNKLCGEWKGLSKCPEKETEVYELYAKGHPRSPKAPEALYNGAWRQAALVDIYKISGEVTKSGSARTRAIALAREVVSQYPAVGDWKPRAVDLIYKLEHNIPAYGAVAD